jgi:iron complex transport system ATP-binding protein
VLSGDAVPDSGSVSMNGRALSAWARRDLARARAVLPQDSALGFAFTALEVVLMGRSPHVTWSETPADYEIAGRALELVEAAHRAERIYPTLSGGERQRVQLARVLAQVWEHSDVEHRYVLLDEPTSNLDLAHQFLTLDVAGRFAREGAGVLVILHDLNLAAHYADEVVLLEAGRLAAAGPPDSVLVPETIARVFGMSVRVDRHPATGGPLVIPLPTARS